MLARILGSIDEVSVWSSAPRSDYTGVNATVTRSKRGGLLQKKIGCCIWCAVDSSLAALRRFGCRGDAWTNVVLKQRWLRAKDGARARPQSPKTVESPQKKTCYFQAPVKDVVVTLAAMRTYVSARESACGDAPERPCVGAERRASHFTRRPAGRRVHGRSGRPRRSASGRP
jgi:hypothetical protein